MLDLATWRAAFNGDPAAIASVNAACDAAPNAWELWGDLPSRTGPPIVAAVLHLIGRTDFDDDLGRLGVVVDRRLLDTPADLAALRAGSNELVASCGTIEHPWDHARAEWLGSPVRLARHVVGPLPRDVRMVRWDDPAQVPVALVPSVEIDLHGQIMAIDWLAPDDGLGGGPVQLDPYGERYTGTLVVREVRMYTEGPLGPVARVDTLTAYREDGTTLDPWTTRREYLGHVSKAKGDARRARTIDRLGGWIAAALATAAGDPAQAPALVSAWASTHAGQISAFRDSADPAPLLAALASTADPGLLLEAGPLGIHLAATEVDPTGTVADACALSLATWGAL